MEEHGGERLIERAPAGGDGARFPAPARVAGTVGGGEDGGQAVGSERGPEGDGGDSDRGRGRRAPLLKQPPEVGGERGVGRGLVSPPGVELAQRAGIGGAGVRA